jgi:hypothetical protein
MNDGDQIPTYSAAGRRYSEELAGVRSLVAAPDDHRILALHHLFNRRRRVFEWREDILFENSGELFRIP